jgi:small subunit ribosomal protein S1
LKSPVRLVLLEAIHRRPDECKCSSKKQTQHHKGVFTLISVGDVIDGTVIQVTDFGLFVTDGDENSYLLGLHELWWDRRGLPSEFASVGDIVKFMVTKVDPDRGANLGSPKKAFPEQDAWREPTRFAVGVAFQGMVALRMSYGVFVEHPSGPWALLHESLISNDRNVALGERLKVRIIASNQETRMIEVEIVE